jgi:hypothetical protein
VDLVLCKAWLLSWLLLPPAHMFATLWLQLVPTGAGEACAQVDTACPRRTHQMPCALFRALSSVYNKKLIRLETRGPASPCADVGVALPWWRWPHAAGVRLSVAASLLAALARLELHDGQPSSNHLTAPFDSAWLLGHHAWYGPRSGHKCRGSWTLQMCKPLFRRAP